MTNPFANGITPELILDMLKRRLWLVLSLSSVITAAAIGLAMYLPSVYIAKAFVLVEGQQIPEQYVRSTVTMGVEYRLQMISQEILSRSRLQQVVDQFGLYSDLKQEKASEEEIAEVMRRDIALQIKSSGQGRNKDTVAFEISYTGPDAQKVTQVANTLASFYIEENMKVREQQALGTSSFLRAELEQTRQKLEEQEQKIAQYKQQYMGELPEQLQANLSTLALLQQQLESVNVNLAQAYERRNLALQRVTVGNAGGATVEPSAEDSVETLKQKLEQLKVRFSDKHPDVIRIKQLIAVLEAQQKGAGGASVVPSAQSERALADADIARLNAELEKIRADITVYQKRIENTPQREQDLLTITRDNNATREQYASLTKRLDEANLADSLEQRQKAERFRLLEPAVLPDEPAGPKRMLLSLIGLVLGLGVGAAGALLMEVLDPAVHRVEDLADFEAVRLLGSISQIPVASEQRRRHRRQFVGAAALAAMVIVVFGASSHFAVDNKALVRMLVKPPSGIALR